MGRDAQLDRRVALKVLTVVDGDGQASARMAEEARILARLEHPGIVPVHDLGRLPDGRIFYAMKMVEGQRLDVYARSSANLQERLRVFSRICEAVAFAHSEGIIHRDLKPENIMVGRFGARHPFRRGAGVSERLPHALWAFLHRAAGSADAWPAARV